MVPVPYPVVADLSNAIEFVADVLINGDPAVVHAQSSQPTCMGDEAGTGGGILSGTVSGECRPMHGSRTVRAAKKWLLRVGDLCSMQGGNTIGIYVAMPAPIPCPRAGEPEPDEDPPIVAQTRKEKAFLERKEGAPPEEPPPPPPTPLRGWKEHLDAFQKLFPVEQFWHQVGLGEFKEALNCGLRFMERGVQGLLAPLLGGIVKDQRKFFQLLDLFNFPRFPMKNPGQALGAKRLKGSTGSMVFESLMRGIPAFVSHPALEWGPKLWGCARKILPKKVVKDLEKKVQRVRAKVLEKLDGGRGVGAPQEPEPVDPAAGGSSIPRPGDGARILKRRDVKVQGAGRPVASGGSGLAEGAPELFEVPPELQAELEERKANPLDQENPVDPGASMVAAGQPEPGPEEVERDTVKAKPGSTITTLVGNDPKAVDAFKKVNGLGDSVIHPGREYKLPTAKEIAEGDRDEGLKQFARDNRRIGEKVRRDEEAQAKERGENENGRKAAEYLRSRQREAENPATRPGPAPDGRAEGVPGPADLWAIPDPMAKMAALADQAAAVAPGAVPGDPFRGVASSATDALRNNVADPIERLNNKMRGLGWVENRHVPRELLEMAKTDPVRAEKLARDFLRDMKIAELPLMGCGGLAPVGVPPPSLTLPMPGGPSAPAATSRGASALPQAGSVTIPLPTGAATMAGSGGGKNAQHANQDAKNSAKDKYEEAAKR